METESRFEEDEDWWNEMRQYVEEHWEELDEAKEQEKTDEEFEDWWGEMKEHMEERWTDHNEKDWWDEMREYKEERWSEQEDGGHGYGRQGSYGGFDGCGRWSW